VHWHNTLSLLEGERTVRTANLHIRRATALRSLLRNPEAIEVCELALEIFESLGDYARCVETCVMLREIYDFGARFQDAKAVVDRAAYYALDGPASLRYPVLAMQAHYAGTTGEIDRALALLDELGKIPEADLPPDIIADAAYFEAFIRHFAGQMKLAEAAARKATKIFETSGNIWRQASIGHLLYVPAIYRGGLDEAEKLILEAIPRATRVGHINAEILATIVLAQIHLTRGYLDSAERIAREALAFAESNRVGWIFVVETGLARILLLRDKIADAFVLLTKAASGPKTYYSGFTHGLLALATAAGGMEGAVDACAAAMRFLPRPGASRGFGAWYAIICLTEALCLGGHRQDVSQLQTEAEKIAAEWSCNGHGFPVRTVAGIAAACAGNWDRAEEHHRAAIARVDAAPDVTAQPIARYWYADMLAERKGTADAEAAKALLAEAITASDAIGLALYARLARQKLAQIASR
jgi:tetratricopeptide (TPR) repeat protein